QAGHVAREDDPLGRPPEQSEGRPEPKAVNHEHPRWLRNELMDMSQLAEGPLDHLIREPVGALKCGDLRGEALADAEMHGVPGDPVAQAHHAGGHSRDRPLPCVGDRVAMQIHAEREVETALDRGVDVRLEVNEGHTLFSHAAPRRRRVCGGADLGWHPVATQPVDKLSSPRCVSQWVCIRRWEPQVFTEDGGIDHRFYELCALSELKNTLRAGDVWALGSRQFKDFEAYLLPPDRFTALQEIG